MEMTNGKNIARHFMGLFATGIATLSVAVITAVPAQAELFTGSGALSESGNSVSGSAEFSIAGDVLTVILTNTTAGGTLVRGDILTGLSWDVTGSNPALTLTSIALTAPGAGTGQDRIFTSATASNTSNSLSGSWTNQLGDSPIGEYGIATTGFEEAFKAAGITRGTGGGNYGIVSDATTFANSSFNGSAFPLIKDSLTFKFSGAAALSIDRINSVKLLYGTNGTGRVTTNIVPRIPEPGTLSLLAAGIPAAVVFLRRRRRAA
jgi:hypothetical protein